MLSGIAVKFFISAELLRGQIENVKGIFGPLLNIGEGGQGVGRAAARERLRFGLHFSQRVPDSLFHPSIVHLAREDQNGVTIESMAEDFPGSKLVGRGYERCADFVVEGMRRTVAKWPRTVL
jgi:hypothetical protein